MSSAFCCSRTLRSSLRAEVSCMSESRTCSASWRCCSARLASFSLFLSRRVIRLLERAMTPCITCERPCSTLAMSLRSSTSFRTLSSFFRTPTRFSIPARVAASTSIAPESASCIRLATCASSELTPRCTTSVMSFSGCSARASSFVVACFPLCVRACLESSSRSEMRRLSALKSTAPLSSSTPSSAACDKGRTSA